jgi:hypothetical protein
MRVFNRSLFGGGLKSTINHERSMRVSQHGRPGQRGDIPGLTAESGDGAENPPSSLVRTASAPQTFPEPEAIIIPLLVWICMGILIAAISVMATIFVVYVLRRKM